MDAPLDGFNGGAPEFLMKLFKNKGHTTKQLLPPSPESPKVPKNTLEYQQYTRQRLQHDAMKRKMQDEVREARELAKANKLMNRMFKLKSKRNVTPPPTQVSSDKARKLQELLEGKRPVAAPPSRTFRDVTEMLREHYKTHPVIKPHVVKTSRSLPKHLPETVTKYLKYDNTEIRRARALKKKREEDANAVNKSTAPSKKTKSKTTSKSISKNSK